MIIDVKEHYGKNITKAEVREVNTRKGKGFSFSVYYGGKEHPSFTSSAVKTEKGAQRNLVLYLRTGKFSLYGNAE